MNRPELSQEEKNERLYGRRSSDHPDMARIFAAPFAAHIWGAKAGASRLASPISGYSKQSHAATGRLVNRLA